jgi:hypothetical protein
MLQDHNPPAAESFGIIFKDHSLGFPPATGNIRIYVLVRTLGKWAGRVPERKGGIKIKQVVAPAMSAILYNQSSRKKLKIILQAAELHMSFLGY